MIADSMLDTNVIVYLLEGGGSWKHRRAEQLVNSGVNEGECCISRQIMHETLNVATSKLGFAMRDALELLEETLIPMHQQVPVEALYRRGLEVRYRYQYNFHDSMIIAAALELGCQTLYSEDLQHGQKIDQLTIEDPFRQQQ